MLKATRHHGLGLLFVLAFALAACGGDPSAPEEEDAADPSAEEEPTPAEAPAETESPDDDAADGEPIRVAILTPGPLTDNGYNADAARSRDLIQDELGAEVALTESVAEANQADVYRQFASQGYDLVIGWGGQFTDGAVTVAEEFADVNFLVVNSQVENGGNLGSIDTSIEDWQFMAGWLMARLTESGTVGWVGALCFPATAANLHGTEQGVEHDDAGTEMLSTFTGDFEDPTVASQAAQAMIESGADVLSGNLNNGFSGVIEAARQAGDVQVITEWADNSADAPEVIVSSILKSQARFVVEQVQSVQDGTFAGEFVMYDLPEDWGPVLADTELLDDDIHAESLEIQEMIVSGEIDPEHDETCPEG